MICRTGMETWVFHVQKAAFLTADEKIVSEEMFTHS